MESSRLTSILAQWADKMRIDLAPESLHAFELYYDYLAKHRQYMNLTAITGVEDTVRLHFLDSLALFRCAVFKGLKVIDVGSGAGFPGIPLKIAEPSIDVSLLDATGKRVKFLTGLCDILSIQGRFIHARAEDAAHEQDMREAYDCAVSRAVADLGVLCELCLPFVRVGGMFIAMKSVNSDDEVAQANNAITSLGGKLELNFDYTFPGTDITHRAIIIRKTSQTSTDYPRRFAKIQNSPL